MSYKPVDATHRRTWDKDEFEKKARERVQEAEEKEREATKPKGRGPPHPERALLKERDFKVDLDSRLGKTMVVGSSAISSGYHCSTCDCVLKDSISYLDHINGKRHQRALGMSMRVERSSVEQVRERLQVNKRKMEEKKEVRPVAETFDFDARIAALQEEDARRKRERKDKKREAAAAAEEEEDSHIDPDLASVMGFGGFGSSKK